MKIINLLPKHTEELLKLEEEMYWTEYDWKKLWEKEAKEKFRKFIKEYLTNFNQGCFAVAESEEILGAMFLLKISEKRPIPYLHKIPEYLDKTGQIAYVSLFAAKPDG